MSIRAKLKNLLVSSHLDKKISAIDKPVGSLGYDPWGFNLGSVVGCEETIPAVTNAAKDWVGYQDAWRATPKRLLFNHTGFTDAGFVLCYY